jgi:acyl dehydratase
MQTLKVGEVISWERTFTESDIELFTQLSGDQGEHHLTRDAQGRLMAHGLLTATLPTKIGGDLNYIAREMTFQFHRPVFAGDTIRCEVTLTTLEQTEKYLQMSSVFTCINQHGKEVMSGCSQGIIRPEVKG